MTTLRERKKLEMRRAIIASAHRLFAKQGYDATTLADIAAGANCSPRTFFQYFDSKEDLLLVGIDKLWSDLAEKLAQRTTGVTALQTMQVWMLEIANRYLSNDPFMQVLERESTNAHLSLQARGQLYSMSRLTEILTLEIAKDLGLPAGDSKPRLIATSAAAMLDAYHTDGVLKKNNEKEFVEEVVDLLKKML